MSDNFEDWKKPEHFSEEVWQQTKQDLRRIQRLRADDLPHEDSVHELAQAENDIRTEMQRDGIPSQLIVKYANRLSSSELRAMESKREGWMDDLTKAWNREALMDLVPRLMGFEQRDGKDISLLMIDFDDFKSINDSYGHPAGDQALRTITSFIRRSVRRSDLVFRYGGDEFAIVLLGTPSQVAAEVAEKIRQTVSSQVFMVSDERGQTQHLRRTVSVGCIGTDQLPEWRDSEEDNMHDLLDGMIKKADGALYVAKEQGKSDGGAGNLVIRYVPESGAGESGK